MSGRRCPYKHPRKRLARRAIPTETPGGESHGPFDSIHDSRIPALHVQHSARIPHDSLDNLGPSFKQAGKENGAISWWLGAAVECRKLRSHTVECKDHQQEKEEVRDSKQPPREIIKEQLVKPMGDEAVLVQWSGAFA